MRTNSAYSRGVTLWTQLRKLAAGAIIFGSALLFSSCTATTPTQPTPEVTKETNQTVEVTSEEGSASTPENQNYETVETVEKSVEDNPGAGKTPQGFDLPKGAYPQAGGPVPPGATKLKVVRQDADGVVAVMKTPTGNIGCDLGTYDGQNIGGCGIYDIQNPPLVDSDGRGKQKANWVEFSAPAGAVPMLRTEIAFYMMGGEPAEVVPYGKVVYYQNFVCASEKVGLTCWNTQTGHGAFVNHKTMKFF